jgi:hypothetical protein
MRQLATAAILLIVIVSGALMLLDSGGRKQQTTVFGPETETPAPTSTDTITPTLTSTATPDSGGFLPPPTGPTVVVTSLDGSRYSDLLVALQNELDSQEAISMTRLMTGVVKSLSPYYVAGSDMPGSRPIDHDAAVDIVRSAYSQGSHPVVQGYLRYRVNDDATPCIAVFLHGIVGSYSFPTATPTETPEPSATPEEPLEDGWPATLESGIWVWSYCSSGSADGHWNFYDWAYGDPYDDVVTRLADLYGADTYYVIRPATATPAPSPTLTPTLTPTPTPTPTPANFNPSADAYTLSTSPTQNYGTASVLNIRGSSSPYYRSYLKFDVSGISGTVVSVVLRLWVSDTSVDYGQVGSVSNSWTETGITWNSQPSMPMSLFAFTGPENGYVTVDVTSEITGNGTYSFGIQSLSTDLAAFGSRDDNNADRRPLLTITTQ